MKQKHLISILLTTPLLLSAAGHAAVTVNFDAVDASGGSVFGAPLDSYMSSYRINLVANTPGLTMAVQDERVIYGGGIVLAPSAHSVLAAFGPSDAVSFRFDLLDGASSASFTRAGLHDATHPQWTATAFGQGGTLIGSVGEGFLSGDQGPKTFTLSGSDIIRSIRFDASAGGFAGFVTPVIDDLVLTPVPEPATYALLFAGLGIIAAANYRSRRRWSAN